MQRFAAALAAAVLLALSAAAPGFAGSLALRSGPVDTSKSSGPEALASAYGFVQFAAARHMDPEALESLGAEVVAFVPRFAYLVELRGVDARALRALPGVTYVGPFLPEHKHPRSLRAWGAKAGAGGRVPLEFVGVRGEPLAGLRAALEKASPAAEILFEREIRGTAYLRALVPAAEFERALGAMAAAAGVAWIDRYLPERLDNASTVGVIQNNSDSGGEPPTATPIWDQDILGTGQIVAVSDSGLDRNEDYFIRLDRGDGVVEAITDAELVEPPGIGTLHPDRKVVGYWYAPGASPYDDNVQCNDGGGRSGYHGTHVTGTVAGDSATPSTPTEPNHDRGDGMAPNAQILFQDIGNDETGCLEAQISTFELYEQAALGGAFIASSSFGFPPPRDANGNFDPADNGYFFSDALADLASYEFEDLLIFRSAGNSGPSPNSIGHSANAKHVVAVGATENGDDPTIAGFSSIGPAHDGRIKPDIVAPGVAIRSAFGDDEDSNPRRPFGNEPIALTKQGTSMSTPAVSGGTALLRQYFMDGFYPSGTRNPEDRIIPSGSLMKAVLLNGTRTYADTPSFASGWGRMWLDGNLYFAGDDRDLRVWDRPNLAGLTTGASEEFKVQVPPGAEFRATLVWRDPPGASFSGPALVNDLDLEVVFDGTVLRGNVFSGGESTPGGSPDRINTTEQVRLSAPVPGEYTIRVLADSVPGDGAPNSDRQGFALAVSTAQCSSAVAGAPDFELLSTEAGVEVIAQDVTGATDYQFYRATGRCDSDPGASRWIGTSASGQLLDRTTQGGFEYAYRVRAADACGEGPVSLCKSVVSSAACTLAPDFDPDSVSVSRVAGAGCGVSLSWSAGTPACPGTELGYSIYRSTDPFFVPGADNLLASGVTGTFYEDLAVEPLVTYYYAVRAEDSGTAGAGPNGGNESRGFSRVRITTFSDQSEPADFLDDPDQLSLVDLDPEWLISDAFASTGALSYHNARPGETYPNLTCASVVTPPLQLQAGASTLSYAARFDLEAEWDGVVVELSTDGGETWEDLPPAEGYPGDFRQTLIDGAPINQCGYPPEQGAFNGVQREFRTYTSDLSAFAGQEVLIRWRFSSDPGLEFEGFFLDDIQVSNASRPLACTVQEQGLDVAGAWFNAAQSGHGWLVEQLAPLQAGAPDRINAYWYVYRDGAPVWLIAQGDLVGKRAELDALITSGADFLPDFDSDDVVLTPWGTLSLEFDSETSGTARWSSLLETFGSGEMPIEQLAPIAGGAQACLSGSYFNPEQSGHGFVVQVYEVGGEQQVLVAWYVYLDGEQLWLLGQAPLTGSSVEVPLESFSGALFPPAFVSGDVLSEPWGSLVLDFGADGESAQASWTPSDARFPSGALELTRLTVTPPRCRP